MYLYGSVLALYKYDLKILECIQKHRLSTSSAPHGISIPQNSLFSTLMHPPNANL